MKTQVPERSPFFRFITSKPPGWFAWPLTMGVFFVVLYVNVVVFAGKAVGISWSLPLIACVWTRSRWQLYIMAVVGSIAAAYKIIGLPERMIGVEQWLLLTFVWLNIWVPTLAIHLANYYFDRLDMKRQLLIDANKELGDTNRELSLREEQVVSQNQELQSQAEELACQTEELRQQAEEFEKQTAELQAANDELTRRERGLQTLLESARWLRSDLSEKDVMSAICQAAVQVMEEGVTAAAVVNDQNGKVTLRGHFGFGVHGTLRHDVPFAQSFARLVMERGQTAYVPDLESRPDITAPQPAAGKPFRSMLATPLAIEGRIVGAVEVYAHLPREWTDGEFKVIEWLAAQCALALQAIEYQQEVVVKRREAEEASVQKTRFLAAVSHDVRTPANAISLMADLIEQAAEMNQGAAGGGNGSGKDGDGVLELPALARDLKTNARSLVELVSDVLDLSRLDTGKRDLQITDFSLLPVLQNEIKQFECIAAEKHLRLALQPLPGDVHLKSDRMKLARIIANLVGNAVKFTEAGAVEVKTALLDDGSLTISVSDTGVGISKESLPRIFDEFFQLQNPERDRNKGSGLGLAICRRLVEALGCTLSVESSVGVGTTFSITLPARLVAVNPKVAEPPAVEARGNGDLPRRARLLEGTKVLLVEDHEVTRRATSRLLGGAGATVLEARGGREAMHFLVHDQPTVLLLDLMLPDADGTEILKHLKLHRPSSLQCVLAVSGDVRDARITEVKELGADDLLAKPLNIDTLLSAIALRLGR